MDSMDLKDFKPDNQDFDSDDEITDSTYHQEINSLKIDKLSNRVTIISIIIPCLIGAILIFAYLDMKERVVGADLTKKNQFEKISQQLEEKLNALDVKIAKNRFNFDNKLPELEKKNISLEGQIAKLSTLKADNKNIKSLFSKIENRIDNNTNQNKTADLAIQKINKQTLAAIKNNKIELKKATLEIKEDTKLFKKEFDTRLLELSNYEQQIGELRKNISLLDKKYKKIDQDHSTQTNLNQETSEKIYELENSVKALTKNLGEQLTTLNQRVTANMSRLQKDIDLILQITPKPNKPKPQINIDSSGPVEIKEESLTQ
jgi:chromosome segregation ATPase